jgi:hypothetical protein
MHKKRRDGVSPKIHPSGFSRSIQKRLFASISRVQIYQIARPKSSNIFVFRADWVRSRWGARSCVKKIFRVFWRFPRNEKGPNLDLPNHSFGERRIRLIVCELYGSEGEKRLGFPVKTNAPDGLRRAATMSGHNEMTRR